MNDFSFSLVFRLPLPPQDGHNRSVGLDGIPAVKNVYIIIKTVCYNLFSPKKPFISGGMALGM